MDYIAKSYRLDEEVIAWLDNMKERHGSVNKALRLVAFGSGEGRCPAVDCGHGLHWTKKCEEPGCVCIGIPPRATHDGPWGVHIAALSPTEQALFPRTETKRKPDVPNARKFKGPLLKPSQQKDK